MNLTENIIRNMVREIIVSEGRKVIMANNGGGQQPPMDPSMAGGAPMDPSMMGGAPMDPSMMGGAPMDPSMAGGAPMGPDGEGAANGESEFDTNFDAGVEADEDTDPKKYIQQLTGKLSQSLGKYYNEQGGDAELSKYVGKMILKQAAKGLDEAGRKELIKAINTCEEPDDDMSDTSSEEMPTDNTSSENGAPNDMGEQPMMEGVFTKAELRAIMESISGEVTKIDDERPMPMNPKRSKENSPFRGRNAR